MLILVASSSVLEKNCEQVWGSTPTLTYPQQSHTSVCCRCPCWCQGCALCPRGPFSELLLGVSGPSACPAPCPEWPGWKGSDHAGFLPEKTGFSLQIYLAPGTLLTELSCFSQLAILALSIITKAEMAPLNQITDSTATSKSAGEPLTGFIILSERIELKQKTKASEFSKCLSSGLQTSPFWL